MVRFSKKGLAITPNKHNKHLHKEASLNREVILIGFIKIISTAYLIHRQKRKAMHTLNAKNKEMRQVQAVILNLSVLLSYFFTLLN